MLPPFIIEQIRQREEKERARREEGERPRLELPLDRHPAPPRSQEYEEDEPNRGVVILELL